VQNNLLLYLLTIDLLLH